MEAYKFSVYRKFMKVIFRIVMSCGYCFACQAFADEIPDIAGRRLNNNWERASDNELNQLRGGFALPNGVNLDFNLQRIMSLNGEVVSSSLFQLPGNVALIQNGNMNQAPDLAMTGLGSVIQNNLDNQAIRTITDINIAVSNIKGLDLNNNGMVFNNLIQPNFH